MMDIACGGGGGGGVRVTLKPAPTRSSVEQGGESHVPVGGSGGWEWPVCGWSGRSGRKGGWDGGDVPRAAWARALRRRNNFFIFPISAFFLGGGGGEMYMWENKFATTQPAA